MKNHMKLISSMYKYYSAWVMWVYIEYFWGMEKTKKKKLVMCFVYPVHIPMHLQSTSIQYAHMFSEVSMPQDSN